MKFSNQRSKTWNDHFFQKAKKEHFPARSVYKLKEIQQKTNLIKKGDKILDLGCSPGSWLKYASEVTGKNGQVTGIDVKSVSIQLPSNVTVYKKDVYQIQKKIQILQSALML